MHNIGRRTLRSTDPLRLRSPGGYSVPNDTPTVTLSGATSEVVKSKGPHRARSATLAKKHSLRSGDPSTRSSDSLAQGDRNRLPLSFHE
jgi:hypothetical protein